MATNYSKKIGFESGNAGVCNSEQVFLNVSDEQHARINQVTFESRRVGFVNTAPPYSLELSLQLSVNDQILPVYDERVVAYWWFVADPLTFVAPNYSFFIGGSSPTLVVPSIAVDEPLYLCAISFGYTSVAVSARIRYTKSKLSDLERALIAYGAKTI